MSVSLVRDATSSDQGEVIVSVPEEMASSGKTFSFSLPTSVTAGNRRVRASLPNGKRLPSWLKYVSATRTFVATDMPGGALPLKILVRVGSRESMVSVEEQRSH